MYARLAKSQCQAEWRPSLRILHLINQLSGRAGAEISLQEILLALDAEDGFQMALGVLSPSKTVSAPLEATSVRLLAPSSDMRGVRAARTVRRWIREVRPTLVHTTLTEANLVGRVAALGTGVPVLVSLVNTPYVGEAMMDRDINRHKHGVVRLLDRVLSRHATAHFHAITQSAADHAIEQFGISPADVTVVPRGRDRKRLGTPSPERRSRARRALGITDDRPVLLNVGRQDPQKGQIYLVEAMQEVWATHPEAELLLVGRDGPSSASLHAAVERVQGSDRVRLLGVRSDIGDLLCAADLFVFPSLYEGLGGSVLEAMAMDVPILATTAPALREVLDEGACARLVPIADAGAIAAGVLDLLDDPAAAGALARSARARFESEYRLDRCIGGMKELYERVGMPT